MAAIPANKLGTLAELLIQLEDHQKMVSRIASSQTVKIKTTIKVGPDQLDLDLTDQEVLTIVQSRIADVKVKLENLGITLVNHGPAV